MAQAQQSVRLGAGCLLAAASACVHTASPRPPAAPPPASSAAVSSVPADPPADWRKLLIAPLGSQLPDLHVALEEVLFFRDAGAAVGGEDAECYATHAGTMRFAGRDTSDYLLCFDHGRLNRIRVTVNLPAASARDLFAGYCGELPAALHPSTDACTASDGISTFSARLDPNPVQGQHRLSIVIYDASSPAPPDDELR
jgi:hypothetical protein